MAENNSPFQQLSLASMAELDAGKAAMAFQKLLARAAEDCTDRPGDAANRTVSLEVILRPVVDQNGDLVEVKAEIQCKAKFPAYRTQEYSTMIRKSQKGSMVVFNRDNPGNINQKTFDMGEDD